MELLVQEGPPHPRMVVLDDAVVEVADYVSLQLEKEEGGDRRGFGREDDAQVADVAVAGQVEGLVKGVLPLDGFACWVGGERDGGADEEGEVGGSGVGAEDDEGVVDC